MNRKYTLFFLFTLLSSVVTINIIPMASAGVPAAPAQLSEDQLFALQNLEQELESKKKEIDNYVATLPPEDQEQFYKDVAAVEEALNNMSEDELNELFASMLEEAMAEEARQQKTEPIVQPETITPESQAPAKEAVKPLADVGVLSLLDSIIKRTNSFIVKTQTILDIPAKVERWGRKRIILEWPENMTWGAFIADVESFQQKLLRLQDQDPETAAYKYLNDFIADKNTYAQMRELDTVLTNYEHLIEVTSFGVEKMSTESKKALRNVVGGYTTCLYNQKVPDALDAIINKYEPTAKKIKEAEQRAAEKARTASGRTAPERVISAGETGSQDWYSSSYPDYSSYGGYDGGYGYSPSPSYSDYSSYGNTAGNTDSAPDQKSSRSGSGGGSGSSRGGRGGKKADSDKEDKKDEKKDGKKSTKSDEKKSDPDADKLLGKIEALFNDIDSMITEHGSLTNLKTYLTDDAQKVNATLVTFFIPRINKHAQEVQSHVNAFERRIKTLPKDTSKQYADDLKQLYEKYKPRIDSIIKTSQEIKETWSTIKTKIAAEKRYSYFKDDAVIAELDQKIQVAVAAGNKTEVDKLEKEKIEMQKAPCQISLYELAETFEKLSKTIASLGKESGKKIPGSSVIIK